LIERANCYIQAGSPELALKDVERVLQHKSNESMTKM
jgi:hypothetical protein